MLARSRRRERLCVSEITSGVFVVVVFQDSNSALDTQDLGFAWFDIHSQISKGSAFQGVMSRQVYHSKVGRNAIKSVAGKTRMAEFRQMEERIGTGCAGEVQAELGEGAELIEEETSESTEVRVCLADLGEIMPAQMTERR